MTTTFNPSQFKSDYPQFDTVSDSKLTNVFNFEACPLDQVVSALFCDDDVKYYWLCVALAHLMTLEQLGLTGRLDSVTQGSESASFQMDMPQWAQYWQQTVYGQKIMQAMETYLAGGHYISNGEEPYLGESMNGAGALGWVQT